MSITVWSADNFPSLLSLVHSVWVDVMFCYAGMSKNMKTELL